ncbi:hypothetical protein [Euzebya tangerina]|uniref:hypothetical protein n=1 Tax=Euzebya tangerina TaxID=591198 RepID=UPI000E318E0B|nr:hypothetical protein [Euzebya tangerina]
MSSTLILLVPLVVTIFWRLSPRIAKSLARRRHPIPSEAEIEVGVRAICTPGHPAHEALMRDIRSAS